MQRGRQGEPRSGARQKGRLRGDIEDGMKRKGAKATRARRWCWVADGGKRKEEVKEREVGSSAILYLTKAAAGLCARVA
jgi:hypothetical protein